MRSEAQPPPAVPEFGEFNPLAQQYVHRPCAYVIVLDGGRNLATIFTPQGIFLPGGGPEPGESPEETVRREVREECGFALQIHRQVGRAIEYLKLGHDETNVRLESAFLSGTFEQKIHDPVEPDHRLVWLPVQQAADRLCRPGQAWIVGEAMQSDGKLGSI